MQAKCRKGKRAKDETENLHGEAFFPPLTTHLKVEQLYMIRKGWAEKLIEMSWDTTYGRHGRPQ